MHGMREEHSGRARNAEGNSDSLFSIPSKSMTDTDGRTRERLLQGNKEEDDRPTVTQVVHVNDTVHIGYKVSHGTFGLNTFGRSMVAPEKVCMLC